jgi:hypothetical protein
MKEDGDEKDKCAEMKNLPSHKTKPLLSDRPLRQKYTKKS